MYITIILNIFSGTAWLINAKFHVEPPCEVGKKVNKNGTDHMTKMAVMVKIFKNLFLQNQKSYDPETWRVASRTQSQQHLYK